MARDRDKFAVGTNFSNVEGTKRRRIIMITEITKKLFKLFVFDSMRIRLNKNLILIEVHNHRSLHSLCTQSMMITKYLPTLHIKNVKVKDYASISTYFVIL